MTHQFETRNQRKLSCSRRHNIPVVHLNPLPVQRLSSFWTTDPPVPVASGTLSAPTAVWRTTEARLGLDPEEFTKSMQWKKKKIRKIHRTCCRISWPSLQLFALMARIYVLVQFGGSSSLRNIKRICMGEVAGGQSLALQQQSFPHRNPLNISDI